MSSYRFTLLRSGGWTRLGLTGAIAVIFATPMLWALGVFGQGDDSIERTLIFLFAGLWFSVAVGYMTGWAVRGFMVKLREAEDAEDGPPHRPATGPAMHPPPHSPGGPPPHRPPGH